MRELRKRCYLFFKTEDKVCGLLFGIVCFLILLFEFLSPWRLGTVDTGKYEVIMEEAGLQYTEEEAQSGRPLTYDHVIEEYDYGHFSYAKLLAPSGVHSVVYPIALIRAVTRPFGIRFSVKYLYLLYAFLVAVCVAVITRGIEKLLGTPYGIVAGVILLLLLTDGNLNAYFASLYDTGTVIIGLLLAIAATIRAFSYGKGKGITTLFPVIASLMFLLNASALAIVFLPFAVLDGIVILKQEMRYFPHRTILTCIAVALFATGTTSCFRLMNANPDIQSDASVYFSAFQGFLETSKDQEKDLAYFGLEEDYAEDIGNSYYLDEKEYQHNPRDEKTADELFAKLSRKKILSWYLKNPARMIRTVMGQSENFASLESQRLMRPGQSEAQTDKVFRTWSITDMILAMILPTNYSGALALLIIGGILIIVTAISGIRKGNCKVLYAVLLELFELGAVGYVPLHLFFMGRDSLELSRIIAVFAITVIIGGMISLLGKSVEKASVWFRSKQIENEEMEKADIYSEVTPSTVSSTEAADNHERIPAIFVWSIQKSFGKIASDKKKTVILVSGIAIMMAGIVLFANPRAGCVNNGDFGRMMEQLGIIWQGDVFYDTDAQLGKRVIEDYAYRDTFHLIDLTVFHPRYSLIFPAALVRGICAVLHQPFSTHWLSIVMTVILLLCVISIIKDMYFYFGKGTVIVGMGICAVFLCESYLVWFNSLFGESAMFLGMFMVATCGIHLAVTPQGKGTIWVFLLVFACRFLLCAKAQMLVTLPVLLVLICVFALYHKPLRLGKLIPYTFLILLSMVTISYEGVKVYQDNSHISERQTLWQSVFYGALMVSDDPEGDMEELGIDTRMAADIGKDAYYPDEDYVISPNSTDADEAFYDHVSTGKMVKYYLKRPVQLIKMLNHAAEVSQELYNGFRAYLGQDYSKEHDTVDRLGLWLYWRPVFAFSSFWGYVLVYGSLLCLSVLLLMNKQLDMKNKLLVVMYMAVMLIGAIQYPLSVIGNGFADNQKQMFGFMMCHDMLTVITCGIILKLAWEHRKQLTWKKLRKCGKAKLRRRTNR